MALACNNIISEYKSAKINLNSDLFPMIFAHISIKQDTV